MRLLLAKPNTFKGLVSLLISVLVLTGCATTRLVRNRYFAIGFWDFDSQDRLFIAGQGRDNLVSNEDVVIKDTFAQIRKALRIN